MTETDAKRSGGLVGAVGPNGNGKAPPARYVELHVRFNLDTGNLETQILPANAMHDRMLMYGLLGMLHDIAYRQQLPTELAMLDQQTHKQLVVVPDGAVPPFPGRI